MTYKELEKKSVAELRESAKKLREELFHLRIKNRTAQLEKKHQISQVRRDVARIQTCLAKQNKKA